MGTLQHALYFCPCSFQVLCIHASVPAEEYKFWPLFKSFSIETYSGEGFEEGKKGMYVFESSLHYCQ